MKKTFSLTLLTLFLMIFSFVIFPVKVFANSTFDGTADDWFNHISQFDYSNYGLARAEIYQTDEDVGLLIVEEPYREFEGCIFEYILSHQSEDWIYFEPWLRNALKTEFLYDPTQDIIELIEGWYVEYFDGFLYWNFEEGYWQVLYYGISELDYYKQRVDDLEDEIQQLEDEIQQLENALVSEYNRGYNEGYDDGYNAGNDEGYDLGHDVGYGEGYDVGYGEGYDIGYDLGYNEGHNNGYNEGYSEGYDVGYDVGFEVAVPRMDILLITLIMYIISIIVYFKFNLKWVLIATILLWFVPIFLVENLFIKIFSVIMIIVTITLTFFGEREEEF